MYPIGREMSLIIELPW